MLYITTHCNTECFYHDISCETARPLCTKQMFLPRHILWNSTTLVYKTNVSTTTYPVKQHDPCVQKKCFYHDISCETARPLCTKQMEKLEVHSVERMNLQQRLSDGSLNKTILKPRLATKTMPPIRVRGISPPRHKIPRCNYMISEKAIQFWHLDYNPDLAQKLISSSMSRHLSTRNISSKSMHTFLSNLANRQTDRQMNSAETFTSSFVGGE